MITIEYCKEGKAISDFEASDFLYSVSHAFDGAVFKVSTSFPINIVRLAIARDDIDYREIVFCYCGIYFQCNEYGAIQDWPKGFADREIAVCEDILRSAMKKRKRN